MANGEVITFTAECLTGIKESKIRLDKLEPRVDGLDAKLWALLLLAVVQLTGIVVALIKLP